MRIYFDTEFTQFRDGQLLSVGFVADDDSILYVEIDEPQRRRAASDFCQEHVLHQFGLYPASVVTTETEAGRRVVEWLQGFGQPLTLSYDYKLDWHFLEVILRASGRWAAIVPHIQAHDISSDACEVSALACQEAHLQAQQHPGRHHALVDAHALRARWREHLRLHRE